MKQEKEKKEKEKIKSEASTKMKKWKKERKISSEPIDVANVVQTLCNTQQLKISRTTAFKVETSDEEQVKTIRLCHQLLIKLVHLCSLYL